MAEDTDKDATTELHLHNSGELLRRAREQKNLSLEDIAKSTRIPQRHLLSIEAGDFEALPGRTYAIGFAKSYARAVGLNDATIGSQLREEMEDQGHGAYQPEDAGYSPDDPSNVPPKFLAWTAAGIGVVVVVGYLIWRTLVLEPGQLAGLSAESESSMTGSAEETPSPILSSEPVAGPAPTGTVVLTATDTVWMKIYDEDGERIFEDQMAPGDTFTVPSNANNPQILTGRPDALTVTIDGQVIPPLGTAQRTIKDVGVSAPALLNRNIDAAGDTVESDN